MIEYLAVLDSALTHIAEGMSGAAVICFSRESADRLRQCLYVARAKAREAGELKYDSLTLSISPHSENILYVYTQTSSGAPELKGPGNP